ncbi:MAG: amidohydrolase [Chitinophagales bacterium]|nr:amidohydrolase [Chitinophagaceae bacterium]MBP9884042.1 amidohydrolase [Chitinophagales bacterium]
MKLSPLASFFLLLLTLQQNTVAQQKKIPANKAAVIASVNAHEQALIKLSDEIWAYAEIAFKETQSSKVLADYAEAQGFRVERGVAGIPTAFTATYGSGAPIIGIMGEFDALPGLSQKAQPTKEALVAGAAGHGCGHNMFGPGSLGAAIAIKELMAAGKLKGTIRFYGTPAEEDGSGKVYMARAGLFNDLDVCLDWHPDYENKANMQSSQAVTDWTVEFTGKSSHAAADPWNGKSALDGAELFTTGVNFLREHIRPSARIHYVYKDGGNVPNVIPDKASVWIWMRDSKRSGVAVLEERVRAIAEGAAMMAGVEYTIKLNSGLYEILNNEAGAQVLHRNMELLGPIIYSPEEIAFAKEIQEAYGLPAKGMNGNIKPLETTKADPDGGSTDVGDISWIVPEITLLAVTAPYESPWHSWVVVACGGMSIGHKGLLFASKSLGMTMVDLFENEALRNEIKTEFLKRKGDEVWKPMLPDGPAPIDN